MRASPAINSCDYLLARICSVTSRKAIVIIANPEHWLTRLERFDRSLSVTKDGTVRVVPTPGHTSGHQSVVVNMGDYYVLIAGDASYQESYMLEGRIDGVAVDAKLHHDSTRRMPELCKRKNTITQFAHDFDSAKRLEGKIFTVPYE